MVRDPRTQFQDNSPDVCYSPTEQAHDWKVHNRFTIAGKVRVFKNFQLIVSRACDVKKFGSIIDYDCQEAMLQQDLAEVTVLINLQWQVKTAIESRECTLWCSQSPISPNESKCPSYPKSQQDGGI